VPAKASSPPPSKSPDRVASHSRSSSHVRSPLEQPPVASSDRSFAGLALGGESVGGWQADQGYWTNDNQPTSFVSNTGSATDDDDDDDDEPILKSRRIATEALLSTVG
jgi:sorting nexin-1/2